MPFDGSGNFTRTFPPGGWQGDATANIKIRADRHDQHDTDLAAGLSNAICRDGQSSVVADIPFNGKKIINLGAPVGPNDAATKAYADSVKAYTTGLSISGADLNGRITFSSPTGTNGLGFVGADLSWLAKLAETDKTKNRLVLNDKADGTGNDVVVIDDSGIINSSGYLTNNLSYDGAKWRTPVIGTGTQIRYDTGIVRFSYNKTASTVAYGDVTADLSTFFTANATDGSSALTLNKTASAKYSIVYGQMADKNRWAIALGNNTAESATRAGSDFQILSYANDGTAPVSTFLIERVNSNASFAGSISSSGNITAQGNIQAVGHLYSNNNIYAVGTAMAIGVGGVGRIFQFAPGWYFNYNTGSGALRWEANSGTNWFIFQVDGAWWISGSTAAKSVSGSWVSWSDSRIKTVLGDYTLGLAELLQVNPRRFKFRTGEDQDEHVGMVAQEIEGPFPETVKKLAGEIDGVTVNDKRQFDPTNLTYALINAVKELSAKLDDAMARITVLEGAP